MKTELIQIFTDRGIYETLCKVDRTNAFILPSGFSRNGVMVMKALTEYCPKDEFRVVITNR